MSFSIPPRSLVFSADAISNLLQHASNLSPEQEFYFRSLAITYSLGHLHIHPTDTT